MAHDRAQSLLLPQPGFLPTQPALGTVSTVTRGFRDSAANYAYQKLSPIILPPGAYSDQRQPNCPPGPTIRQVAASAGSTDAPPEHDHHIITHDELEKLMPDPKPDGRIEVGLLPDGSAYAPKTGENYLLFPSKSSYILYFTHHYFSRENLSRDVPLLSRMINRMVLPLDELIKAPRLTALGTTPEEVQQALTKSKIVCVEDLGNGLRGVRRIDGFPAVSSPNDASSTRAVTMTGPEPVTNTVAATSNVPNYQFQPPTTAQPADFTNDDERALAASLADVSFTNKPSKFPTYSFSLIEQTTNQTNALVSPNPTLGVVVPGTNRLSPNQSISCPANQPTYPTASGQSSTAHENPTSPAISNGSACSSRPTSAIWPQPTFSLGPNNRSSLLGGGVSQPLDSPSITNNNHSSILGFPSRPPYGPGVPTGNLQSPDIQPLSVLPMRHQTALPPYLLSQPTHCSGTYPASLPFCQMCYSKSSMNMAVAAAMGNPHQQLSQAHLSPKPQFPGQIFHGQATQVPSLNAHQANVALAAANSYHAAVAALAAAAQQQVAPAYFNAPMASNLPSQMQHMQQSVQPSVPVYYAAQPLSLPTHFQRHPLPRFPHGSVYPIQSYQQSNQNTALHSPAQQSSEVHGSHPKEISAYSTMGGNPQVAATIAYPFFFQPRVHLSHANQPLTNHSMVSVATPGLHIQYPQQTTSPRQPPINAYGLTPVGLTVVNNSTTVPLPAQNISDENATVSVECQGETHSEITQEDTSPMVYGSSPSVQATGTVSPITKSPVPCSKMVHTPDVKETASANAEVAHNTRLVESRLMADKPETPDDSEDSASSGIGEMNSAGSSGPIDTRTSSSLTLTDQPLADQVTSTTCEFVRYRRHSRSVHTKEIERSP
ncbi:hypothetical protein FGIG_08191 [Fasciola gigantica]|uniref:Uncharacterized protein n=1 Tax=Fasciola gigantica TaxID=46835 RepID=A0A504YIE9_FASGI|nr:hypothetical protein FGIG_08191 [Fasciola gigantica]